MDVSEVAISFECKVITCKDKTQFFFDKDEYVVPFSFPIKSKDGLLFNKISDYVRTDRRENGKVVSTDVCFQIYYIELFENVFKKAMEDFKNIILLECSDELKEDILVKAFLNILHISTKSYDKACAYITDSTSMTYNTLEGTFNRRFKGSFREYCGFRYLSKEMRIESLNEEDKMKIIVNGDESDQQVKDLKRILKNATKIELKIELGKKTELEDEIARTEKYVELATYIHNLIDLICKRLPHLKESYVQTTPYPDLKDCRANWRLVDWIHAFPTDEKRLEFLLYKDNFLYIASELTIEYMRCDGVPKEYIDSPLDISKNDYGIDESLALLQKFREIV